MTTLQYIILALVQGITEFLPISSSAHLVIPSQAFGWLDQGLVYDVAVHIGSLLAVIAYFWKDIISLVRDWCISITGGEKTANSRMAWYIGFATIPAVIFGGLLTLSGLDESMRSLLVLTGGTLVFGALLGVADYKGQRVIDLESMTFRQAIIIGFSQAAALIPGTSRSGITMTAALFLGFTREAAARFSFLLSIPIILAAGLLKTLELMMGTLTVDWGILLMGVIVSAVSALICIHFFLSFINRIGLMPFVIYRMILGVSLLAIVAMGVV